MGSFTLQFLDNPLVFQIITWVGTLWVCTGTFVAQAKLLFTQDIYFFMLAMFLALYISFIDFLPQEASKDHEYAKTPLGKGIIFTLIGIFEFTSEPVFFIVFPIILWVIALLLIAGHFLRPIPIAEIQAPITQSEGQMYDQIPETNPYTDNV